MNIAQTLPSSPRTTTFRGLMGFMAVAFAAATCFTSSASAQTGQSAPPALLAVANLPDAPGFIPAARPEGTSSSLDSVPLALDESPQSSASYTSGHPLPMAAHRVKYIAPGQSVLSLTVKDKFALGFKDAFSTVSLLGWTTATGYEQGINGSPNYGTNAEAFGKRFGASVARATSEGIFSDAVMASVFHEDPRYYRMGAGHSVFKRVAYAATRTLISRTDSGRTTPNLSLLSGNLAGAYLTKAYYPDLNTTNGEVLKTFAGSIAGSALGFGVNEFFSGALNLLHLSRNAND